MKTIILPIDPQPVLADPKPPGRWIWGHEEPITDMCRGGNSCVSWWNDHNEAELVDEYCPIARPVTAKVRAIYDGEKWCWVVTMSDAAAKKYKPELLVPRSTYLANARKNRTTEDMHRTAITDMRSLLQLPGVARVMGPENVAAAYEYLKTAEIAFREKK